MGKSKLRRQIAYQAGLLMYQRQESEYYRAKIKAARQIFKGAVKPRDLPSNAEVRDEILNFARMFERESREDNLLEMRIEALRVMRALRRFRPCLIGSVWTGRVRKGSDIDLHLFADSIKPITSELDFHGFDFDIQFKRIQKNGERQLYKHIYISGRFPIELTVYPTNKTSFRFKCSITGKAIEQASIAQLEQFFEKQYPNLDLDSAVAAAGEKLDRFQVYYSLLLPLENVKQNPRFHPEGDVLYHSLQVFDLACDCLPYDEEFLLAALLHDVGKGVDRYDHVQSGLAALEGFITERTSWLIEHHMLAHKIHDRTLGFRALKRLQQSESFDELTLLGDCDRNGRQVGAQTSELEEALDYVRQISDAFSQSNFRSYD